MILHLIDDFSYSEATARLPALLAELVRAEKRTGAGLSSAQQHIVLAIRGSGSLRGEFEATGIRCLDLGSRQCDPLRILNFWRVVQELEPTIVHHWGYNHFATRTILNRLFGNAKKIVTAVNPRDVHAVENAKRFTKTRFERVIAESNTLSELIPSANAKLCITAASNLLPTERATSAEREALLAELGFATDSRVGLISGPLVYDTRIEEALWATDQSNCLNINYVTLVHGTGPAIEKMRKYARLYGAENRVAFLEERYDWALAARSADVYLAPDLLPGANDGLLRAIAFGLPVIAADSPAHRELVTHGENGLLFDAQVIADFSRAIARFVESPELESTLRSHARSRAELAKEKWKGFVESHAQLYNEVQSLS